MEAERDDVGSFVPRVGAETSKGEGTVSTGGFILRVYLRLGFGTITVESGSIGGFILRVYLRLGNLVGIGTGEGTGEGTFSTGGLILRVYLRLGNLGVSTFILQYN